MKRAKEILHKFEDAIIEVQELKEEVAGTLAVGSTIYCAALMLEKVSQMKSGFRISPLTFGKMNPSHCLSFWKPGRLTPP